MKKEIENRAEELSENKKPFCTKLSPKARRDLEEMVEVTSWTKSLITELAYEFLLKNLRGK